MIDLRKRTYEILGLEEGSLSSEGGRDWNEASSEAKQELKTSTVTAINKPCYRDGGLSDEEILIYMRTNDKDIILHFVRNKKLTKKMLEIATKNNTFLVNRELKSRGYLK